MPIAFANHHPHFFNTAQVLSGRHDRVVDDYLSQAQNIQVRDPRALISRTCHWFRRNFEGYNVASFGLDSKLNARLAFFMSSDVVYNDAVGQALQETVVRPLQEKNSASFVGQSMRWTVTNGDKTHHVYAIANKWHSRVVGTTILFGKNELDPRAAEIVNDVSTAFYTQMVYWARRSIRGAPPLISSLRPTRAAPLKLNMGP